MARWLLRCGFLLAALSPLALGLPALLALWLLMPLAVECSRVLDEHYFLGGAIIVMMIVACLTQPMGVCSLGLIWGGCGLWMCISEQKNTLKRGLLWTGLGAVLLCLFLYWLGDRCPGGIFPTMAEVLTVRIGIRPDAGDILMRCYQMGFSRLEADLQPAVRLLGRLAMSQEVRDQLLYSLRYTLETSLRTMTPQLIAAWLLLTLVLTTALPDVLRRRRGEKGVMPPFGEWRMTDWARRHLNLMAIIYLASILADSPVFTMVGSMCAAAFQYAYLIFGLAVMEGMTRQYGTVRFVRRLWMAGCILFAPFILVILGMADRMFDVRRLSRSTEDKGGFEQ